MTEMQHDERLARRVQAAEDRKRPRANPDDERDAVRSRAMQDDDVEFNQSSEETSGDGNSDQPGSGEMQVEGQVTQAPAAGVKRFAEVAYNVTLTQDFRVPMPVVAFGQAVAWSWKSHDRVFL